MITANIIKTVHSGNVLGNFRSTSTEDVVMVVADALLLEDGRPLLLEDGRHLQLESEIMVVNTEKK